MATVTITALVESDSELYLTCNFANTTPAINWTEVVVFGRERLNGMAQAQIRDEILFPVCQKIIAERIGVRRAQLAATSILNVAQTVPATS